MRKRDAFFEELSQTQRRAAIARDFYLANRPPSWHGTVERRAPGSYRKKNDVVQRCTNQFCREYPPKGSRAAGRCLVCNTPLSFTGSAERAATPRGAE